MRFGPLILCCLFFTSSCENSGERASDGDGDADGDVDGDADGDGDGDGDADGDADDDSVSDADSESDGDVEEVIEELVPPQPANRPGPYSIGVTTIELVDSTREDRPLTVEIWYPASPLVGARTERYEFEVGGVRLAIVESPLGAVRDARFNSLLGRRPFVLFSHGNGGDRVQSLYLTEYLATHGFIVVSPDHTGNTMSDLMAGVERVDTAQSGLDRPQDMSFLIDEVVERTDETVPLLSAAIDAERIGISGHSFGGYTSMAIAGAAIDLAAARVYCVDDPNRYACFFLDQYDPEQELLSFRDERVKIAVPLAPGGYEFFGAIGVAQVSTPVFIQAGTMDEATPFDREQGPMFDNLTTPGLLAQIEGAGHFTFTDVCILVEIYGAEVFEAYGANFFTDGCNETNIDIEVGHQIINTLTTAYLQLHLEEHAAAAEYLVAGEHHELQSRE